MPKGTARKQKKPRKARKGLDLAHSRYIKTLRAMMPGTTIFYCDLLGNDAGGVPNTQINGAGRAIAMLDANYELISKEITERLWNWQVVAFSYCDNGKQCDLESASYQAKGVQINTIDATIEAALTECREITKDHQEITWGWLAIIRPDGWDQNAETDAAELDTQATLIDKIERNIKRAQIAALEALVA